MTEPLLHDFHQLIESATDLVVITRDGKFSYANPAALRAVGYELSEFLTLDALDIVHPDDREMIAGRLVRAAQGLPNPPLVTRLLKKDGAIFSVSSSSFSLESDGRLSLVLMGRDLSEHYEVEAQKRRLEAVLSSAPVAIMTLDASMRVTHWNRTAETMWLWPRHVPGIEAPLSPTNRQLLVNLCERAQQTGETATTSQTVVRAADGSGGDVRAWAAQLKNAGERADGFVVLVDDLTERNQLEKRAAELRDSLRRAEPFSAMGELVAGVAHEVRNPLFGMGAALDVIEARGGQPDKFLQLLRGELERLNRLMRDLLDYGKPPAAKLSPEPLGPTLNAAVRACAVMAAEGRVSIVNSGADPIAPLMMDGARLAQVFQNLLANAVQHSQPGGEVHLEARQAGDRVEVRVLDRGPGFRPEDLPRIFEPFFTRRRGGTGLGLAIVQRIVEQHGGIIVATNRLGGGAEVRVSLPGVP